MTKESKSCPLVIRHAIYSVISSLQLDFMVTARLTVVQTEV